MSAAEITAIIAAIGAVLTGIFTYRTSARNTDLETIRLTIANQNQLIEDLQQELVVQRDKCEKLEDEIERLRQSRSRRW